MSALAINSDELLISEITPEICPKNKAQFW